MEQEFVDTEADTKRETSANAAPPYLSPSSSSTFTDCQRRWEFRYIHKLSDPPGEAALAGTFAHRVLELLMEEPGANRTIERAKAIAREVWPDTANDSSFIELDLDDEQERRFRWTSWKAIEGLWSLEDPTEVVVVSNELRLDTQLGDVPFRGFVDRLERADKSTDAPLVISDYKSGKPPSDRFAHNKLDQVLLYAAGVEAETGERPTSARLLYLGNTILEAEVTDDSLATVVGSLNETWVSVNAAVETNTYEPSPGPLCGWCPYVDKCPEGLAEVEQRQVAGRMRSDAPALVHLTEAT